MTVPPTSNLDFRPISRDDFPLLSDWLSHPHVQMWWPEGFDPGALEARYGPVIDRTDPTECFVVVHDGEPVGSVQRYLYVDNPDWQTSLAVAGTPENAAGIDLFIGVESLIGTGLGPAIIDRLVETTWLRHPEIETIVVNVSPHNRRSWRRAIVHADYKSTEKCTRGGR